MPANPLKLHYRNVTAARFGYALPPNSVSSAEIEERLRPLYQKCHIQPGQLTAVTGIKERRYWDPGFPMQEGALAAARNTLSAAGISGRDLDLLIYAGVCRDQMEPATSCAVAAGLGVSSRTRIYDLSNACLGIVNGMIEAANAIELGQIETALIVSCESAREIVGLTIERMLEKPDFTTFRYAVATLTGGSGAAAVLMTRKGLMPDAHPLLGGVVLNAVEHHKLCTWGPDIGVGSRQMVMNTDSVAVMQKGISLAVDTFSAFKDQFGLRPDQPDKIICHQVGAAHQKQLLKTLDIDPKKDFTTFGHLGNIGTVSLPLTVAVAAEQAFFNTDDLVGLFGIGSGLNCIMLGIQW